MFIFFSFLLFYEEKNLSLQRTFEHFIILFVFLVCDFGPYGPSPYRPKTDYHTLFLSSLSSSSIWSHIVVENDNVLMYTKLMDFRMWSIVITVVIIIVVVTLMLYVVTLMLSYVVT